MGVFHIGVLPSQGKYFFDDNYCSKENQKEKIEADGIKINHNGEKYSYLVDEFKKYRFNLSNYRITVMKTDEEQFEQNIIEKL